MSKTISPLDGWSILTEALQANGGKSITIVRDALSTTEQCSAVTLGNPRIQDYSLYVLSSQSRGKLPIWKEIVSFHIWGSGNDEIYFIDEDLA